MTDSITAKLDALMEQVATTCGDLVDHVTIDETEIKPSRGKVSAWLKPPEIEWPYQSAENELSCRLVLVAGSPWSQGSALPLLLVAMDRLATGGLPVASALPVGFQRGDATLAAYQIEINDI